MGTHEIIPTVSLIGSTGDILCGYMYKKWLVVRVYSVFQFRWFMNQVKNKYIYYKNIICLL